MKFSHAAIRTTKDAPHDAESVNAKLLTQGGFIKKEMAGVYTLLPLGKRVVQKIEQIIREEMWSVNSQEVGMPALTPRENWEKTGRADADISFCPTERTILGWSHEEIVTPLSKEYIRSWKDLPLSLFQIQTKFRNEPRAKSGMLRGREFVMKDMYSFHATQEDLEQYYQQVLQAYLRVYQRAGLQAYVLEASGGAFTKKISHEFSVITQAGEDMVIFEMGANGELIHPQNSEIAIGNPPVISFAAEAPLKEKEVHRPRDISGSAKEYGIHPGEILKTVVFSITTDSSPQLIGISIRGDLEINEDKLQSYFQTDKIRPASNQELTQAGLVQGFISPIQNTKIPFYADTSVTAMTNFCTGANQENVDYFHANSQRDCQFKDIADFVLVKEGFTSKETGHPLKAAKCVEVGNIFDLGTKYAEAFGLRFTDKDGQQKTPLMGCYGIGVTRLMGTAVEAFHDDNGIMWPKSIAPYHVLISVLGKPDTAEFATSLAAAESIEQELQSQGVEVLVDDRSESPGKKFADADLIGIPLRLLISPRTLENDTVEWKERTEQEAHFVPTVEVVAKVLEWIRR